MMKATDDKAAKIPKCSGPLSDYMMPAVMEQVEYKAEKKAADVKHPEQKIKDDNKIIQAICPMLKVKKGDPILDQTIPGVIRYNNYVMRAGTGQISRNLPIWWQNCLDGHSTLQSCADEYRRLERQRTDPTAARDTEREMAYKYAGEPMVAAWAWDDENDLALDVNHGDLLYVLSEEYIHETRADRMETKYEPIPDNWNDRILRYRGRLAYCQNLRGRCGYVPRKMLIPARIYEDMFTMAPWYVGVESAGAVKTIAKNYLWHVGDFVIHNIPFASMFGNKVYFMWLCLPNFDVIDDVTQNSHISEKKKERSSKSKAKSGGENKQKADIQQSNIGLKHKCESVKLIQLLIKRDLFGRYLSDARPNMPFASLTAMVIRGAQLGVVPDKHGRLPSPIFGVRLRGGVYKSANPSGKMEQRFAFHHPPNPHAKPDFYSGQLMSHKVFAHREKISDVYEIMKPEQVIIKDDSGNESEALLGSGNFGIVYIGVMPGIDFINYHGDEQEATYAGRVAINDLFEGASSGMAQARFIQRNYFTNRSEAYVPVAIKVLHFDKMAKAGQEAALRQELAALTRVRHRYCVRLLGLAILSNKTSIVMELLLKGSALTFLQAAAERHERIGTTIMATMLYQVAQGMGHLESLSIVHRDLSLRNVMIAALDPVIHVKVADFGLSVKIDGNQNDASGVRIKGESELPYPWMAPESLEKQIFSHKTDVWSFGILAWEVFTHGGEPYAQYDIKDLPVILRSGQRLQRPDERDVTDTLWRIVEEGCWADMPQRRPHFRGPAGLVDMLRQVCIAQKKLLKTRQKLKNEIEGIAKNDPTFVRKKKKRAFEALSNMTKEQQTEPSKDTEDPTTIDLGSDEEANQMSPKELNYKEFAAFEEMNQDENQRRRHELMQKLGKNAVHKTMMSTLNDDTFEDAMIEDDVIIP